MEHICLGSDGQHHGDEQDWGEQIQELGLIGLGDQSVVSDLEHYSDVSPYFGLRQC